MTTRHYVIILLSSNHEAENHLSEARLRLGQIIHDIHLTDVILSEAVGEHSKGIYHNQLAEGYTSLPDETLVAMMKDYERDMGRTAEDSRQGIVCMDLDLLAYDDTRHHERDWNRHYVLRLLPQLQNFTHTDGMAGL